MELRKCKECVNYLQITCPFFMNITNEDLGMWRCRTKEDLLNKITENARIEFGINCFQTEEDKWLCDMMCGETEDD